MPLEGPWLQAGGSQAGAPAPNPPGRSRGGLGTLGSGSLDFSWFSSEVVFELGNVSGFPFLSPALQFSFFQQGISMAGGVLGGLGFTPKKTLGAAGGSLPSRLGCSSRECGGLCPAPWWERRILQDLSMPSRVWRG